MAPSSTEQEALWLRIIAKELDPDAVLPGVTIFCNNKGAIDLEKNAGYRPKTNHIDIRHHFLRECVEKKEISIKFIPTEEMAADVLIKGLFGPKMQNFKFQMGVKDF